MIRTSLLMLVILCQFKLTVMAQRDSIAEGDTLKNRLGVTRLQSFYDNNKAQTSITSLEYSRLLAKKSTIIGRVNYSDRDAANGLQFEAETYWNHNASYYSFASLSVANNDVFPSFKGAYSLNRNFRKGWEGELGYRYLRSESLDVHSAIVGVGKYIGNYWLNIKGYLIDDAGNWQQSYRFTGRYYVNDRLDYITFIASTGTSPDDRSRVFEDLKFGSFLSKSLALGYKRSFQKSYSASFVAAWNNQKISDVNYLNQFDLYFSLSKYF